MIEVGPLLPADRERWAVLWRDYLAFYETVLPPEQFDATWSRLMAGEPIHGFGARREGRLVGLTHYLFHDHAWSEAQACYLQDLFTDASARGMGVARALIGAVADAARRAGATRMYWLTQSQNATARALYDKVAVNSGFVRYVYAL